MNPSRDNPEELPAEILLNWKALMGRQDAYLVHLACLEKYGTAVWIVSSRIPDVAI